MKVLILSCNTGGGHNAAGRAVEEALRERGHEAVMLDYLQLSGKRVSRAVGDVYVNMVKYVPWLFGGVYQLGMGVSLLLKGRKSPVYYVNSLIGEKLGAYIREQGFDAVVMPHLYPAETLTYLKRHGETLPFTLAVATDYTCIPFWEETECDAMVVPAEDLVSEFVKRGISSNRLYPLGIPVSPSFLQAKGMDREVLRKKAGIGPEEKVYLVMGGSMGFGKIGVFVRKLCRQCGPGQRVIVICGSNGALRKSLQLELRSFSNVKILGYTSHVAQYMAVSDVIYTKPGGLTSTEVGVMEKPLIHTAPIPGCETQNREYFIRRGMSVKAGNMRESIRKGQLFLEKDSLGEQMGQKQRQYINPKAAEDICILLENMCEKKRLSNCSEATIAPGFCETKSRVL